MQLAICHYSKLPIAFYRQATIMEEVTIKTSTKYMIKTQVTLLLQLLKLSVRLGIIIAIGCVVYFIYQIGFNDLPLSQGLKDGAIALIMIVCGAVISIPLGGVLILVLFDLIIVPIALLCERVYSFSLNNNHVFVVKNGKTIIDVPKEDVKFTFVNTTINGLGGNDLGTSLRIEYITDNKTRKKEINLGRIPDEEKLLLHIFVQQL